VQSAVRSSEDLPRLSGGASGAHRATRRSWRWQAPGKVVIADAVRVR
jgi:hypothetical protein